MKKIVALCLILTLLAVQATSCYSQTEAFHIQLLQAKKGGLLAFSGKKHSFTLNIARDSIRTTDAPNYFTVDNQIFQVSCVPVPNDADLSSYNKDQQKTTLDSYADYELEYFQKELKMTVKNLKKEWVVINDRLFLLWQYDVTPKIAPKDLTEQVTHQIFMSAIFHDQILDLNTALIRTNSTQSARQLLYDVAGSLKTYEKQLDISMLTKEL